MSLVFFSKHFGKNMRMFDIQRLVYILSVDLGSVCLVFLFEKFCNISFCEERASCSSSRFQPLEFIVLTDGVVLTWGLSGREMQTAIPLFVLELSA